MITMNVSVNMNAQKIVAMGVVLLDGLVDDSGIRVNLDPAELQKQYDLLALDLNRARDRAVYRHCAQFAYRTCKEEDGPCLVWVMDPASQRCKLVSSLVRDLDGNPVYSLPIIFGAAILQGDDDCLDRSGHPHDEDITIGELLEAVIDHAISECLEEEDDDLILEDFDEFDDDAMDVCYYLQLGPDERFGVMVADAPGEAIAWDLDEILSLTDEDDYEIYTTLITLASTQGFNESEEIEITLPAPCAGCQDRDCDNCE